MRQLPRRSVSMRMRAWGSRWVNTPGDAHGHPEPEHDRAHDKQDPCDVIAGHHRLLTSPPGDRVPVAIAENPTLTLVAASSSALCMGAGAQTRIGPASWRFAPCGRGSVAPPADQLGGPCVLSKFAYLTVCRSIQLLVLLARGDAAKDLDILVLRHQLAVLRRQTPSPRFEPADRALLAAISRALPRARWSCFFVNPETVLRWHRRLVAGAWTYPHRGTGRPPLDQELEQLIVRLARENPRWGYQRIQAELLQLGMRVLATAIRTTLRRHGLDPAPRRMATTWLAFLRQQAAGMRATSLLSTRSGCGGCMCCSSSNWLPAGSTWGRGDIQP
jgi:hypothetical protein